MKEKTRKRILEIIPGSLSWSVIIGLLLFFVFKPLWAAVLTIVFLLYWSCRLFYLSILLIMAHHRVATKRKLNWLQMCKGVSADIPWQELIHLVLYPTYKEPRKVLENSLNALKGVNYPKDKIIVVLAGEAREEGAEEKLVKLKEEFQGFFRDILVTIHPKDIPAEIAAKGANATYAAKKAKEYLEKEGINLERVVISCFDADTCVDKNYFACLTYNFISKPNRFHLSFQPFPIYSNNIYSAPAFARVIEMGSTFWQLIESMRYEKFITFSSHSMSFKTLIEVDYWPVNMISDDSLIFWKCFLKYNGDYRTYPLEVPVYMDMAVGEGFFDTLLLQYRQKRRWAWGVENFVFLCLEFRKNKKIPFLEKARRAFQLLDNHVSWATWAIIITFITPLSLFVAGLFAKHSLILFNISYINSILFNALSFILILCIVISYEFLPPRPPYISRFIYIKFMLQWFLVPLTSAFLGSFPALDAQTRLMFAKYLYFQTTPKMIYAKKERS